MTSNNSLSNEWEMPIEDMIQREINLDGPEGNIWYILGAFDKWMEQLKAKEDPEYKALSQNFKKMKYDDILAKLQEIGRKHCLNVVFMRDGYDVEELS